MSNIVPLTVVTLTLMTCGSAAAQGEVCDVRCDGSLEETPFSACFGCDDLWMRPTLTGDWGGLRTDLQESGFRFAGRSTHFAFGVDGGITASPVPALAPGDTFLYTGRGEYDLHLNLEKFGGLPHGSLLIRLEHWYGEYGNVSLRTGAFAPAVFPAALPPAPDDPGQLYMSNFVITQPLSEQLIVYVGKKDVLGAADQDVFAGGDGTDQFVNQALIANPAFLLGLPYTGFTAGAAMPQQWGMISAFVYDPKDRTQDFFDMDDLFAQGVIIGGEVKFNTNLLGLPGEHHVGGMWKHVDLTDLRFNEPPPGQYPEPTVPGFPTLSDSWTIYYGFDQYLKLLSGKTQRGWGVFGRASISDGNPTPLRYFLSAGLGGDSDLRRGKDDRWGIGWYYVGASQEFGPIPQFLFAPQDGTGVELFYNVQVNPWLNVTPDVQYIRPEASAIADDAFVYGIRVNLTL
ncbi:MAG: carbohydrate porin [Planctomyces sp.]|nr:carbohydrate porin [Planctomyces sp.]